MQGWLTKFLKLEQENELLHDMVRNISAERNIYRTENRQLMDEVARLRCEVGIKMNSTVRLGLIAQSYDRFFRTRDTEHLKDVERILGYDGLAEFEE